MLAAAVAVLVVSALASLFMFSSSDNSNPRLSLRHLHTRVGSADQPAAAVSEEARLADRPRPAFDATFSQRASPQARENTKHANTNPPRKGLTGIGLSLPASATHPAAVAAAQAAAKASAAKVLLYTMDSIASYGTAASKGGPAGEILIRRCLTAALGTLGYEVHVVAGDDEFFSAGEQIQTYTYIIVDPWTIYGKGWKPRPFLVGREDDTYVLDFFGAPRLGQGGGLGIHPSHLLTASPTKWNTFLGFFFVPQFPGSPSGEGGEGGLQGVLEAVAEQGQQQLMQQHGWQEAAVSANVHGWTKSRSLLQQEWSGDPPPAVKGGGVIWGKKASYLSTPFAQGAVSAASSHAVLGSTASAPPRWLAGLQASGQVRVLPHMSPAAWRHLLCSNAFLLGLGDPLAGPSAWEAVACGAAYVDVQYALGHGKGVQGAYKSQHPWVAKWVPPHLTCTALETDSSTAGDCVERIMKAHVSGEGAKGGGGGGFIPQQLTPEAYLDRVQSVFGKASSRRQSAQ